MISAHKQGSQASLSRPRLPATFDDLLAHRPNHPQDE